MITIRLILWVLLFIFMLFACLPVIAMGWAFVMNFFKPWMKGSFDEGLTSWGGRIYSAFIGVVFICFAVGLLGSVLSDFNKSFPSTQRPTHQTFTSSTREHSELDKKILDYYSSGNISMDISSLGKRYKNRSSQNAFMQGASDQCIGRIFVGGIVFAIMSILGLMLSTFRKKDTDRSED